MIKGAGFQTFSPFTEPLSYFPFII